MLISNGRCTEHRVNASFNTGGPSSRCEELLLFFYLYSNVPWHSYRRRLLLHNDRVSLRETWLWPLAFEGVPKFSYFCNKNDIPQCLVVLSIVSLLFTMGPWSKVHGLSWTVHSHPLVRVNLLAQHSARALIVSMVDPDSMITLPWWLAFFDKELCSVRRGDEFGLEFNWKGALNPAL